MLAIILIFSWIISATSLLCCAEGELEVENVEGTKYTQVFLYGWAQNRLIGHLFGNGLGKSLREGGITER